MVTIKRSLLATTEKMPRRWKTTRAGPVRNAEDLRFAYRNGKQTQKMFRRRILKLWNVNSNSIEQNLASLGLHPVDVKGKLFQGPQEFHDLGRREKRNETCDAIKQQKTYRDTGKRWLSAKHLYALRCDPLPYLDKYTLHAIQPKHARYSRDIDRLDCNLTDESTSMPKEWDRLRP